MKNSLLFFLVVGILWSCSEVAPEISYLSLNEKEGVLYNAEDTSPFTGMASDFFLDGSKKVEGSFVDGKRDGLHTWWYEDGTKMCEYTYAKGVKTGTWITYYPSGRKQVEQVFENGSMVDVKDFPNIEGAEANPNGVANPQTVSPIKIDAEKAKQIQSEVDASQKGK